MSNKIFKWKILIWKGVKKVALVFVAGGLTALIDYLAVFQSNTTVGFLFLGAVFLCNSALNWVKFHNK